MDRRLEIDRTVATVRCIYMIYLEQYTVLTPAKMS